MVPLYPTEFAQEVHQRDVVLGDANGKRDFININV